MYNTHVLDTVHMFFCHATIYDLQNHYYDSVHKILLTCFGFGMKTIRSIRLELPYSFSHANKSWFAIFSC